MTGIDGEGIGPVFVTRKSYPSLLGTVGLLLATLVVAGVLSAVTMVLFPDWPQIIQMAAPTEIALAGAVAYAVLRTRRPWREALGVRFLDSGAVAPLMLVLVGAVTVFSEIYLVIQRIVPVPEAFERMLRDLMRINGPGDLVATVAIAVVVAPVLEEALFRGVLLQGLARSRGAGAATIWTAVFFSLYHLYNPWQVLPTFFLGLVLAWVVLSTRSLLAGILVHAAFNGVSLAIFAAPISEREPTAEQVPWVVAGIFVLLLLGSVAFLVGMAWLEGVTGGGAYGGPPPEVEEGAAGQAGRPPGRYPEERSSRAGPFSARG
jgi:membrane protease YdiL (CAAX protease family)